MAGGATGTFTVVYKVTRARRAGLSISDTATVNAANQSFGSNAATATDLVATATQADLMLSTASTPATVFSGNNITYTQTITNNGPAAAAAVSFTEPIPTNTTFSSVSAPVGWTCTVDHFGDVYKSEPGGGRGRRHHRGGERRTHNRGRLDHGDLHGVIDDERSQPANNSTTTVTTVSPVCDLAVTNIGTPSPVAAGAQHYLYASVTNTGPSNCSTATFSGRCRPTQHSCPRRL